MGKAINVISAMALVAPRAAQNSLKDAKSLLEGIPELLKQGKVSDAAHNLAEANRLMNEAFQSLKLKVS
jgi:ribosomal protein L7/L12